MQTAKEVPQTATKYNTKGKEPDQPFEGHPHGISEERLIDPQIEHPLCPNCGRIYWKPYECTKCYHTICEPCLPGPMSAEGTRKCPKCTECSTFQVSGYLENQILPKLEFKCKNTPECSEVLIYSDVLRHSCPYEKVQCPHEGCKYIENRKDLEEHTERCEYKEITCPAEGCLTRTRRNTMDWHQSKECKCSPLPCLNDCGTMCTVENTAQHLLICPKEFTNCKYKVRGCQEEVQRSSLLEHYKICIYRPRQLKCGHQVSLCDVKEHKDTCPQYPMTCDRCKVQYIRDNMENHECKTKEDILEIFTSKFKEIHLEKVKDLDGKMNQLERDMTQGFEDLNENPMEMEIQKLIEGAKSIEKDVEDLKENIERNNIEGSHSRNKNKERFKLLEQRIGKGIEDIKQSFEEQKENIKNNRDQCAQIVQTYNQRNEEFYNIQKEIDNTVTLKLEEKKIENRIGDLVNQLTKQEGDLQSVYLKLGYQKEINRDKLENLKDQINAKVYDISFLFRNEIKEEIVQEMNEKFVGQITELDKDIKNLKLNSQGQRKLLEMANTKIEEQNKIINRDREICNNKYEELHVDIIKKKINTNLNAIKEVQQGKVRSDKEIVNLEKLIHEESKRIKDVLQNQNTKYKNLGEQYTNCGGS